MRTLLVISSLLLSFAAHAQGVLTLQGVVTERTPETIVLKVDQSEFKIERAKLAAFQEKDLEKALQKITLQVPIDAIESIRAARGK